MSTSFCFDIQSFVERISSIYSQCKDDEVLIFRGHSDSKFVCLPGLLRNKDFDLTADGDSECSEAHKIMIEYPEEFNRKDHLSCLVKMQHYGLKTRLLDFTRNPLVALYFACNLGSDCDGSVIAFKLKTNEVKHHSSDTVLCLSSLPFLSGKDKDELLRYCHCNRNKLLDKKSYESKQYQSIHHLYHEIRSQYPTFETEIKADDLLTSFFVAANKDNERMKTQNGLFAIFGLDKAISKQKVDKNIVETIVVPHQRKSAFLKMLEHFGMDDSIVYPGLDRAAAKMYGKQFHLGKIGEF